MSEDTIEDTIRDKVGRARGGPQRSWAQRHASLLLTIGKFSFLGVVLVFLEALLSVLGLGTESLQMLVRMFFLAGTGLLFWGLGAGMLEEMEQAHGRPYPVFRTMGVLLGVGLTLAALITPVAFLLGGGI